MTIAFLTPEYPHFKTGNSGGIGTSIKNLALGLLAKGILVRVLVYGQKEEGIFNDDGIVIQQIKNVKFKGLSWFLTRKKIEKIIDQLYTAKEIDLVEAPDWTGITSFIQPRECPLIIRLHGSDAYFCHLDERPVKWVNKFHEKHALKKAAALLSVSQFAAVTTNAVFGLNESFTVIPNLIDIDLFKSVKSFSQSDKNILYFGSLIRKKGLLELPYIFNKVVESNPEAKLVLIGKDVPDIVSGNSSTWKMMQESFSEKANKQVSYLGSIPYSEIKSKIEEATICVFPSFAEAFPVSWLEAMAMQKAIVASNIGWAKEMIVDGESGFLAHPSNHDIFAAKILQLLNNPVEAEEMGENARIRVEQFFSRAKIVDDNINFYRKVINQE
ncbi:glycosyltransferase family 4 protein [Flavobacterium sp. B183]|uniref:glycosyltransferase family 4 protein n=1 Tax=Flavobacterium sp. B183 TaxID=907046 RepID=UPI00201F3ED4|nr:glycosyltransferase family 4 protein [Flavobacterium sp. B183]URC13070.1 glycosyltransferase family 4 protein [Flavobacterium sp. B183]